MTETEFSRHFLQGLFTGEVFVSPKTLSTPVGVRKFVFNVPGAIGYLRAADVDGTVKVIKSTVMVSRTPITRAHRGASREIGMRNDAKPSPERSPRVICSLSNWVSGRSLPATLTPPAAHGVLRGSSGGHLHDWRLAHRDREVRQCTPDGARSCADRRIAVSGAGDAPRTLYALTTNDSNLQVEYADQSRAADRRVSDGITDYMAHAGMPREVDVGQRLEHDWSAYLKVRDEVLASILEGSIKEAVDFDLAGGVPSFDHVRQDLEDVKRLYDEQASQRLAMVDLASRRSAGRLVGVLCFTLLFASVSVWAIQRAKMLSALKLAKLQMDFVASVSHELRTPLAVICASAQNIADGVVEEKEQLAKYGSVIRNHTRQLTDLVNQILLFASTQEGRTRYVLRPLQVPQIVAAVLRNTRETVEQAGFTVELYLNPDLPG